MSLSESDINTIKTINVVVSSLASVGSTFVILTYLMFPRLRVFSYTLVFWLAFSELMFSISNMMGQDDDDSPTCMAQSLIQSYFGLAMVFWTTTIAFTLKQSIVSPLKLKRASRHLLRFFLYCFGLPAILTAFPFLTDSYGQSGGWCWLKNDSAGRFWRFMQFYLPLWTCMAYNARIAFDMRSHIEHLRQHMTMVVGGDENKLPKRTFLLFPLVLLISWTFATINRVQQMISPDHPQLWLFILHVLFCNAQGLFHAVAFGFTRSVRNEWHSLITGAPIAADELLGVDGGMSQYDELGDGEKEEEEDENELKDIKPRGRRSSSMLEDVSYKVRAAYQLQLGIYDMFGIVNSHETSKDELLHSVTGFAFASRERARRAEIRAKQKKAAMEAAEDDEDDEDEDDGGGHHGGHGDGKTSVSGAFFTLFKSFVGLGVLALPSAARQAGYALFSLGLVAIAAVSYFGMRILLDCKYMILEQQLEAKKSNASIKVSKKLSFGQVGRISVGAKWGQTLVQVCLIVMQLSCGVGYLIFIGENVAKVAESNGNGFRGAKEAAIALFAGACVPLMFLKSVKNLVIPALIADLVIVFGLVTIFGFDFSHMGEVHESSDATNFGGLPLFFGIAVFAFEGIGMVLPVESAMEEPERFGGVLRKTMAFLTVTFVLIGAISYGAYGEHTEDIILFSLPQDNKLVQSVQIMYCVALFLTLPVMLYPALGIMERYSYFQTVFRSSSKIHRTAIVFATAGVACAVPKFGLFINLVGSVTGSLLAFILPAYFFIRIRQNWFSDWFVLATLVFGVIGGGISLVVSIAEFFK